MGSLKNPHDFNFCSKVENVRESKYEEKMSPKKVDGS
jgi:hypothetical protein